MKVQIDTIEKTIEKEKLPGLFNMLKAAETYTVWRVSTHIELSEEERAIMSARKLWDTVLYMRTFSAGHLKNMDYSARILGIGDVKSAPVTIEFIFEHTPYEVDCYDPVEAQACVHELKTKILPRLKSIISSVAASPSPESFEL